jgi:hypothetical protein
VQILALVLVFGALAGDRQLVLLGDYVDVVRAEASDGDN